MQIVIFLNFCFQRKFILKITVCICIIFLGLLGKKNPRRLVVGEEKSTVLQYCLLQGTCSYGRSCRWVNHLPHFFFLGSKQSSSIALPHRHWCRECVLPGVDKPHGGSDIIAIGCVTLSWMKNWVSTYQGRFFSVGCVMCAVIFLFKTRHLWKLSTGLCLEIQIYETDT